MEREKNQGRYAFRKTVFGFIIVALSSGVIFWGLTSISKIQSGFSASIDAVGQLGIYAQGISSHVQKIAHVQDQRSFEKHVRQIKAGLYKMRLTHASLMRGNPQMAAEEEYASVLKSIYSADKYGAQTAVETFINTTQLLLKMSPEDISKKGIQAYFRPVNQRQFIAVISGNITRYNLAYDQRISEIIFSLVGAFVALVVMAAFGYALNASLAIHAKKESVENSVADSVATVLNEVSLMPDKEDIRVELMSKNMLESESLVRN